MVKNPPANAGDSGDVDLISGSERSPGGRNGNPLHYSSHGQRSLAGYSPGTAKLKRDWAHAHMHHHLSPSALAACDGSWLDSLSGVAKLWIFNYFILSVFIIQSSFLTVVLKNMGLCRISITWVFVENANSWVLSQIYLRNCVSRNQLSA